MITKALLREASIASLVEILADQDRWYAQHQPWAITEKALAEAEQIRGELKRRGVSEDTARKIHEFEGQA